MSETSSGNSKKSLPSVAALRKISAATSAFRTELGDIKGRLRRDTEFEDGPYYRPSRERTIAIEKIQEAIMWLDADLKDIEWEMSPEGMMLRHL